MVDEGAKVIKVLFFGAVADATGCRDHTVSLDGPANVELAVKTVIERYPRLAGQKLLTAVNEEYAAREHSLNDGDELAIFTAVSGG